MEQKPHCNGMSCHTSHKPPVWALRWHALAGPPPVCMINDLWQRQRLDLIVVDNINVEACLSTIMLLAPFRCTSRQAPWWRVTLGNPLGFGFVTVNFKIAACLNSTFWFLTFWFSHSLPVSPTHQPLINATASYAATASLALAHISGATSL